MAKRYMRIGDENAAAEGADGPAEEEAPKADIAYHAERIGAELTRTLRRFGTASRDAHDDAAVPEDDQAPRALVFAPKQAAKQVCAAIAAEGIRTVMPLVGDWRLDGNPKAAHESVSLEGKPSRALFSNAHAVLAAADAASVQTIFLGGDALPLATDNRFLVRAADAGILVFAPLEADATHKHWVACEPARAEGTAQPTAWRTCHACKLTFDDAEFAEEDHACPGCKTLARLTFDERLAQVCDEGTFVEWDEDAEMEDPLQFPGYAEKIQRLREKTGLDEAVRIGEAKIGGFPAAVGIMDSHFLMGSMGSAVGRKVSHLFDYATLQRLPVVLFCASGGARMQEGLASLMQMAKTACAVQRHGKAGLLYISVLTDPTTGGVTASFATLGDIILAEPKTLIGFAGQRVIRDTIKQELPEGFQTAEFALEHGLIDAIVKRERMKEMLRTLLSLHASAYAPQQELPVTDQVADAFLFGEAPGQVQTKGLFAGLVEMLPFDLPAALSGDADGQALERHARRELKRAGLSEEAAPGSAWESVQLARNVHRPTSMAYLRGIVDVFVELHGDREFGDDPAIIAGIGKIGDACVTIIAEEKGADLQDRIRRNFGCPHPEGYRKAARMMRQAEKFNRPIICLVDTQGAFCGTGAEERGQGNAIAENLMLSAGLHVPVISVILGEGGSGGALALALANTVAMQENAVYSILSPEGFASILWKDGKRAPEAAEVMRMSASQVLELEVVDAVIPEGAGPAHENPEEAVANVRAYVESALAELKDLSPHELRVQRQLRFSKF